MGQSSYGCMVGKPRLGVEENAMAPVYVVEEWLKGRIGHHAILLAAGPNIGDIDLLCDALVKQLGDRAKSFENPGILVVCADWKPFESSRRFEQNGVRLLKHLRLTPELGELRRMHVIVLSFEPVEELIRRKPGSLVLLSPGVTFLRLPEDLRLLGDQTFLQSAANAPAPADATSLRHHIAADYVAPDRTHETSDWWGVHQIFQTRAFLRSREEPPLECPARIRRELARLRNKEALYLHGGLDHVAPAGGHDVLLAAENEIENLFSPGDNKPGKKIVLLDDFAEEGWKHLLRETLFENVDDRGLESVFVAPPIPDSITEDWVQNAVLKFDPDLVLLDLRLHGNREHSVPVKDTTGAKVLEILRREDLGLPVVLMTASNKYWTYRDMLRLGADGYWMKAGLGEHQPPVAPEEHYAELFQLVKQCLSGPSADLRGFSRFLRELKMRTNLWWENKKWPDPDVPEDTVLPAPKELLTQTNPGREGILRCVETMLSLLRGYVQMCYLNQIHVAYSAREAVEAEQLCGVVLAGGKVIEAVHCFDKFTRWPGPDILAVSNKNGVRCEYRKDFVAYRLYWFRNWYAHRKRGAPCGIQYGEVRDYVAVLLAYLLVRSSTT